MVALEDASRDTRMSQLLGFLEALKPASTESKTEESDGWKGAAPLSRMKRIFQELERRIAEWLRQPLHVVEAAVLLGILFASALIRVHFASFLDPFEDGYQNWWISANLVSTGQYWDRHSMMTQGNWLPLYHFVSAGVLEFAGLHNMEALKATNIIISSLTSLRVFLIARREGLTVSLAASAFFSFSFIDIAVSG